jgi:hypothetical protein
VFKKTLCFAIAFGVVLPVSALDMSAGIYGKYGLGFTNMGKYIVCGILPHELPHEVGSKQLTVVGGFGGFFDITYAEVNLGISFDRTDNLEGGCLGCGIGGASGIFFDISASGKYPVNLGGVTLFPLTGFTYSLCMSIKHDHDDIHYDNGEDFDEAVGFNSRFFINLGGGMDIPLNEKMFIRPAVMYNLGFPSKRTREVFEYNETSAPLTHGFRIKISLGFGI